jgi:DNA mismatch endonuclease (patch repair protein)
MSGTIRLQRPEASRSTHSATGCASAAPAKLRSMTDRSRHPASRASWASSPATRRSMQANRGRDTRPELALRRAVHAMGLRYRVSMRPIPSVRRTADLVFTRARLAVFVDGCFWHGCPEHHTVAKTNASYWAEKVEKNRARDRETDDLLAAAGWIVVRVWEHEDSSVCAARIREVYRSRIESGAK